ncbi:MAG: sigma factor-like helix-turn-helix DNA-binding protein [Pseudomonadota bacterium]
MALNDTHVSAHVCASGALIETRKPQYRVCAKAPAKAFLSAPNTDQQHIWNLLRAGLNPYENSGVSKATTRTYLQRLCRLGYLRIDGHARNYSYVLIKAAGPVAPGTFKGAQDGTTPAMSAEELCARVDGYGIPEAFLKSIGRSYHPASVLQFKKMMRGEVPVSMDIIKRVARAEQKAPCAQRKRVVQAARHMTGPTHVDDLACHSEEWEERLSDVSQSFCSVEPDISLDDALDLVSPEDPSETIATTQLLRLLLLKCTAREERVLRLRYGIKCEGPRRWQDIADEFGIVRERRRQIVQKALGKMRFQCMKMRLLPRIEPPTKVRRPKKTAERQAPPIERVVDVEDISAVTVPDVLPELEPVQAYSVKKRGGFIAWLRSLFARLSPQT